MLRVSVLSLSGYHNRRAQCLALQQPDCQNAEVREHATWLYCTLGPHATTSTSGVRGSRIHDSKSLALGNPECRDSDTPDSCHLSTLGSTVSINSGNRPSRFQMGMGFTPRQPRFADVRRESFLRASTA
jgi:hypothetical protein